MCALPWLLYLCQPWWVHPAFSKEAVGTIGAVHPVAAAARAGAAVSCPCRVVSFLFVAAFCIFDAHEPVSLQPAPFPGGRAEGTHACPCTYGRQGCDCSSPGNLEESLRARVFVGSGRA